MVTLHVQEGLSAFDLSSEITRISVMSWFGAHTGLTRKLYWQIVLYCKNRSVEAENLRKLVPRVPDAAVRQHLAADNMTVTLDNSYFDPFGSYILSLLWTMGFYTHFK